MCALSHLIILSAVFASMVGYTPAIVLGDKSRQLGSVGIPN